MKKLFVALFGLMFVMGVNVTFCSSDYECKRSTDI